ncbi:hypothetical protein I550_0081 [Mycobacterium intracellulare 1956]|uniref:Uncharacterized protein n=1 Tax=Mycobacterium intracellulare 1956 TaxID=1299331 RepID=X8CLI6_MYCIT|nr:hypothetical protein I550_0081 [Mycobacterium intracellulare 1956]
MRSATRRIRSAFATEDPPYFCTTSATFFPASPALGTAISGISPQQNTCRRMVIYVAIPGRPERGFAAVSAPFLPTR